MKNVKHIQSAYLQITELKWQKFGHILRLDQNTPTCTSMLYYFSTSVGLYKGADRTTIVTTINTDRNRAKKKFQMRCIQFVNSTENTQMH